MPPQQDAASPVVELLRRAAVLSPSELAAAVAEVAARGGYADARIYVTDYSQERLVELQQHQPADRHPAATTLSIDGSLAGRVYSRLEPLETDVGGQPRVLVPLLAGMERLGVLEVSPTRPGHSAEAISDLAALVAHLLVSTGQHADYLQRARRLEPMSIAAEMQWALLPPLTFGSAGIVISGLLEPCYHVGGDAFDYALDTGEAVVGIFDAMGHGVEASLLSSLVIGAYRNSRRIGLDLRDTYTEIDRVLSRHRGGGAFVTAVLGRLELASGRFAWVNAGHLPPLLLRGTKVVRTLEAEPALPLGLGGTVPGPGPQPREVALEPGDRLLLFTDGIVEARSPDGKLFGEERLIELVRKATASGHPAAEAMRRLRTEIMSHQCGDLRDDATILFVEWQGPSAAPPALTA